MGLRAAETGHPLSIASSDQRGVQAFKVMVDRPSHFLESLRALPKALFRGKSLLEWTEYQDVSLWWFVHTFYETAIRRLESDTPPSASSRLSPRARSLRKSRLWATAYTAYEFFALVVDRSLGIPAVTREDRTILLTAHNYQWKLLRDPSTGASRKGDAYFDSLFTVLRERGGYAVVSTYPLGGPPSPWYYPIPGLRTLLDKRRNFPGVLHRPVEAYWSRGVWRQGRKARGHFTRLWGDLRGDVGRALRDVGDRAEEMEEELSYYFVTMFGRVVEYLEIARRMVAEVQPDLLLLLTEYGLFERALVVAGKEGQVPVLALQHGVIHPEHPGYIVPPGNISPEGSVRAPYYPIPDVTAVYGPYHKDLLTQRAGYPKSGVQVTGQPRYDQLAHFPRMYDREAIRKSVGVDPETRFVLWTTQTHGLSRDENEQNVQAVYGAVRDLNDVQLVLKLHPVEDQRALLYRDVPGYVPVIVDREGDTFALLFACDLLITRYSTTAMEAIALGKPVIILNLSGEPDLVDYVREGVAEGVYRPQDLRPAIERLLSDSTHLSTRRGQYVAKYLFKADGKATERVVELIDQLIEA